MSITKVPDTSVNGGDVSQPEQMIVKAQTSQKTESHESTRHPLGVRPNGNALLATKDLSNAMGIFSRLPGELLLNLLEYFEPEELTLLGSTCRALFAYCSHDQLWRDLALRSQLHNFRWQGSWRASLRRLPHARLPEIDCRDLFSDALHRPFLCSQINLEAYVSSIPLANKIAVFEELTTDEFNEQWTSKPFILTKPVRDWDVYSIWSQTSLGEQYGEQSFRAEAVDWPLKVYLDYMHTTEDESPLYLFDRSFVEKMGLVVGRGGDYEPPACFQEDLFTVFGAQRPDHRWLIVGPRNSGSTFHKDPNATSAWNAVVRGVKYWIMFPPSTIPPGVFMSSDQSEVTSPLSIAEWLMTFHEEARSTPGCIEAICGKGEVLHVPSGWWHLVVNLEPAIAITQNFVPRSHLQSVIKFLDEKRGQISGFKNDVCDPLALFTAGLEEKYPELVPLLQENASKKRKWEEIVGPDETTSDDAGTFIFGFGGDIDSDLEDEE
jgi:hypothetical protein